MLLACPQNVLPVEYGSGYDAILQSLAWEFLTRVDELLPVPNLKEVGHQTWSIKSLVFSQIDVSCEYASSDLSADWSLGAELHVVGRVTCVTLR